MNVNWACEFKFCVFEWRQLGKYGIEPKNGGTTQNVVNKMNFDFCSFRLKSQWFVDFLNFLFICCWFLRWMKRVYWIRICFNILQCVISVSVCFVVLCCVEFFCVDLHFSGGPSYRRAVVKCGNISLMFFGCACGFGVDCALEMSVNCNRIVFRACFIFDTFCRYT